MKKELILKHAKTLLVGLLRALQGTVAMATLAFGVVLCIEIPHASGFVAVGLFVAALLFAACGLLQFYNCGRNIASGNKKGEKKK